MHMDDLIPKIEIHYGDISPNLRRKKKPRYKEESDDEYLPIPRKSRRKSETQPKPKEELAEETKTKTTDNKNGVKPLRVHGKTWHCKKCPMSFPKVRLLREHRKIHLASDDDPQYNYIYDEVQDIYNCNTCDAECATKEEIEKHLQAHKEQFRCQECDRVFTKAYNFATHVYEHSEDKIFRCPLCAYTTLRRTCLLTHVNRMHLQKFPYKCETCGKGFTDVVLHKEHNNEHLGLKPFVCVVCDRSFPYSRYLLTHQIRNHRVHIEGVVMPTQCPICFRVFGKVATMEKHYANRHGRTGPHEKRHLCDICGKGFAAKDKLKVHYRVHTGIKPYTCSYCAKSFTKKDYLIMHERIHSGEKPYSCEYCGKSFNQGAPLRIHVRSHTGERPYVCHICHTGFISKGTLNLHFKTCQGSTVYND